MDLDDFLMNNLVVMYTTSHTGFVKANWSLGETEPPPDSPTDPDPST
jgi:hypothetical protein